MGVEAVGVGRGVGVGVGAGAALTTGFGVGVGVGPGAPATGDDGAGVGSTAAGAGAEAAFASSFAPRTTKASTNAASPAVVPMASILRVCSVNPGNHVVNRASRGLSERE